MFEQIDQFHFLRPAWLFALLPAAVLLTFLAVRRARNTTLTALCDAELLPHLLVGAPQRLRRFPFALLGCAWLLAVLALAGPAWQRQPQPVFRMDTGRVLVLDLSPSMAAADVTPNRLERARFKSQDLLRRLREGRTGLVVFGGEPHVVVPLTEDSETIVSLLPALGLDVIPEPGDRLEPALDMAADLLRGEGARGGEILLFTDGIADTASALVKAAHLRRQGIRLSVLGIGTAGGAPVPKMTGGGFEDNGSGALRLARLDESALAELAAAGGGRYSSLRADDRDLIALVEQGKRGERREHEGGAAGVERWQDEGVWLLPPLLLLALVAFRRGLLLAVVLAMCLLPSRVEAMSWRDFWLRSDQQAARLLEQGEAARAAELFQDLSWRAVAQHEAGQYDEAAKSGEGARSSNEFYNRGNSLARAGHYEEALQAYGKALERDPDNKDAAFNRNLVKKLLEQQKEQNGQQNQQEQKQGEGQDEPQGGNDEQSASRQQQQKGQNGKDLQRQQGQEVAKDAGVSKGNGEETTPETLRPEQADRSNQHEHPSQSDQSGQPGQAGQQEQSAPEKQGGQPEQSEESKRVDRHAQGEPPRQSGQSTPKNRIGQADQKEQSAEAGRLGTNDTTEQSGQIDFWLRQVPDDPSGLLRRKFLLEHQRRLGERR